jgi:hypothetical protein
MKFKDILLILMPYLLLAIGTVMLYFYFAYQFIDELLESFILIGSVVFLTLGLIFAVAGMLRGRDDEKGYVEFNTKQYKHQVTKIKKPKDKTFKQDIVEKELEEAETDNQTEKEPSVFNLFD